MEQQLIIDLSDFRYARIACGKCKTQVVLDLAQAQPYTNTFTPESCPGCAQGYDSAVKTGLNSMNKAYVELSKVTNRGLIRFLGAESISDSASRVSGVS